MDERGFRHALVGAGKTIASSITEGVECASGSFCREANETWFYVSLKSQTHLWKKSSKSIGQMIEELSLAVRFLSCYKALKEQRLPLMQLYSVCSQGGPES